jgi:hypothetical protein
MPNIDPFCLVANATLFEKLYSGGEKFHFHYFIFLLLSIKFRAPFTLYVI